MVEPDLMTHDRISNQTRKKRSNYCPSESILAGNTSPGSQYGVLSEKRIRLKAERAREILKTTLSPRAERA